MIVCVNVYSSLSEASSFAHRSELHKLTASFVLLEPNPLHMIANYTQLTQVYNLTSCPFSYLTNYPFTHTLSLGSRSYTLVPLVVAAQVVICLSIYVQLKTENIKVLKLYSKQRLLHFCPLRLLLFMPIYEHFRAFNYHATAAVAIVNTNPAMTTTIMMMMLYCW